MNMEKKLTAQGPKKRKSYTVTLPIEWVKQEGLDKVRKIELDIVGDKIIISSHKGPQKRHNINSEDYAGSIIKVLQGLYRAGVDEIKISFIDNKVLSRIIEIIEQKLIGCEIVEQKNEYIIIKEITKESEEDFKVVFRRILLLLIELSEAKADAIQVKSLDKNIKKLINYCQRILMKKGHIEFKKTHLYYLILDRLEKISDEFRWLLLDFCSNISSRNRGRKLRNKITEILRAAHELFYKYDVNKYKEHSIMTYRLKNKIKLTKKVNKATIHFHNLARLLNSLYGDIFTLKFDD